MNVAHLGMNSYKTTGSRPWDGLWGREVSGDPYKILVQCAVKVKGATRGLDNTPSLTQILQVTHLTGTLNYFSFQDL